MGAYPDPPNVPVTSVQTANAYQIVLDPDEGAAIEATFTGTATGCTLMVHQALEGGPIFAPQEHNLGISPEHFTWEIPSKETKRAYFLSAWTYRGPDNNPNPGWFQVVPQNVILWIHGVGGRVMFTCDGSVNGPTHVDVVIKAKVTH